MFFDRYLRTDGPDNYIDNETCRHGVFEKCSLRHVHFVPKVQFWIKLASSKVNLLDYADNEI